MKIAIITDAIWPYTVGGSEIRNHEVAKRLVQKGHDVHIFGGKFWNDKDKIKDIDGVIIHGISQFDSLYKENSQRKITDSIKLAVKLFFEILKSDFDIYDIAAFSIFNVYSVWLACLIKRKKVVLTWHQFFGKYLIDFLGKWMGGIGIILERLSLFFFKKHIVVSEDLKNRFIKLNIKEKNIYVVNNGVDVNLVENIIPSEKKSDLIFVGRLHYQKNVSELIDLVFKLKQKKGDILCFIVGDGPDKIELDNKVKKLNLEDNIKFFGQINDKEEVYSLMKSSKIFVLTSRMEGSPLTVIEAIVCRLKIFVLENSNYSLKYLPINLFNINNKNTTDIFIEALDDKAIEKVNFNEFDWQNTTNILEQTYLDILK